VHEVWLRLVGTDNPTFENRAHFFAAAAEAMRHLLIDNARRKLACRHGGGLHRVDFENVDIAMPADEDHLLAVNDALDKLAARNPLEARVVNLRFFVGMTNVEAAQALGLSERTVKNYWTTLALGSSTKCKSNGVNLASRVSNHLYFTALLCKSLIINGAGEGNRALVTGLFRN